MSWHYIIHILPCLASFTQHICDMHAYWACSSIFTKFLNGIHCMNPWRFLCPFASWWTQLELLLVHNYCEHSCHEHPRTCLFEHACTSWPWYKLAADRRGRRGGRNLNWVDTACVPKWLDHFCFPRAVYEGACSTYEHSSPFYSQVRVHRVDRRRCMYVLISWRTFELFLPWGSYK